VLTDEERYRDDFCQFQKDTLATTMAREGVNFNGQQGTLNTCVVALTKLNTPEPLKINVKMSVAPPLVRNTSPAPVQNIVALIVEANKDISPVDLALHCAQPFRLLDNALSQSQLSMSAYSVPVNRQVDSTNAVIGFTSPAWPNGTPLVIWVLPIRNGFGPILGDCKVTQR
jgi:hypothetical protein